VVHDTGGGGEDHVSELTGGQELDDPFFEIAQAYVITGGDDTGLVEAIVSFSILHVYSGGGGKFSPAVKLNDLQGIFISTMIPVKSKTRED
jgi:hypothetical protein